MGSCGGPVFVHFFENVWANFGDPFWDQMGLRGAKMGSKRPIKSFKVPKTCICKKRKKLIVFDGFWGSKVQGRPRQPWKAQEGSQEAPKELQGLQKSGTKNGTNFCNCLNNFWDTLGPILVPKSAPKGDQKWDQFWNRVPPALRGPGVAFSGVIREVWKSYWSLNYILQKKGRD